MKTLLRIDASIRISDSTTRNLADHFESNWLEAHPDGKVLRRCLTSDVIPHLSQGAYEEFSASNSSTAHSLSDRLIAELESADHILIGSPLYNFSISSSLKAYLDHIVRFDQTFVVEKGIYRGLLEHISATIITARSSISSPDYKDDFQSDYLCAILNFIGIKDIQFIGVEATGSEEEIRDQAINCAKEEIDHLFMAQTKPEWIGSFSDDDKRELSQLRLAQAEAIVAGDADHYAQLCTRDIQLLIPTHEMVSGIEKFAQVEQNLFSRVSFDRFIKSPIRIERSGDLAVEVGTQEVTIRNKMSNKIDNNDGVFASSQKYTHIFRKTDQGWRFAVLMSNPNN